MPLPLPSPARIRMSPEPGKTRTRRQGDPPRYFRSVRRGEEAVVTTAGGPDGQPGDSAWRQRLTEDDWLRHLTTLEGWQEFTTAETIPPELLSDQR